MFDLTALHEPKSVDEAVAMLREHPGSAPLAGGTDVLVKLRDGKMTGREWVSLQRLDALREIRLEDDGTLRVGTLATFSHIAGHELVQRLVPSLGEAVSTIGGPQVRNAGTLGGNICNGVPSADSASTCFAWKARVEITGPNGVHTMPIEDFYVTVGQVRLEPGELLTAVLIDKESYEDSHGAYYKYAMRNAMDIATVNCSTVVKLADDKRTIADARICFGVAGPVPMRAPHGEQALIGRPVSQATVDAAAKAAIEDTKARDSWRASKAFREHMLTQIARRCLSASLTRAGAPLDGETR